MKSAFKVGCCRVGFSAVYRLLLMVCCFGLATAQSQDKRKRADDPIAPPAIPAEAAVVPVAVSRAGVDETVRFGVSLTELHSRTADAVAEVLWSHSDGGVDAVTGFGFAIKALEPDILVTVLPEMVEVDEKLRVDVRLNGGIRPAAILRMDEATGVALLQMTNEGEQADAEDITRRRLMLLRNDKPQSAAVVFGFDRGSGNGGPERCVPGRIAGRDSRYMGETLPTSLWRVHMNLTDAQAGGPLLNETGEVVGVMTARELSAPDEHHSVPVPVILRLLRDLGAGRQTGVAWIGATFHLESSTPQIVSVRSGSPALQAGLRSQDVVVSIGGETVRTLDELADAFYYLSAGQATQVEVLRGLEKLSFRLVPALFDNRDLDGDGVDDGGEGRVSTAQDSLEEAAVPLEPPSAAVRRRN